MTITPLGAEVEPEVYWRKATAPPSTGAGCQPAGGVSSSSVASQESAAAPGVRSSQPRTRCSDEAPASATAGCASARIASSRGILRCDRGGQAGTAITPAYRQPKKAAMKSSPGG